MNNAKATKVFFTSPTVAALVAAQDKGFTHIRTPHLQSAKIEDVLAAMGAHR